MPRIIINVWVFLLLLLHIITTAAKFTPLMLAAREGNLQAVKSSLSSYAKEIDEEDNFTALIYATFPNDDAEDEPDEDSISTSVKIIQVLLSAGEDPNHYDKNGYTALTWAAQNGHIQICRALVDGGAAINPTSKTGLTPLLVAIVRKKPNHDICLNTHLFDTLLSFTFGFCSCFFFFFPFPFLFQKQNHRVVIRYLLTEVRVDVNVRTSKHVTPLISAVSGGDKNVDIVRMLLENGAKISDRTLDLQSMFYVFLFFFSIYI